MKKYYEDAKYNAAFVRCVDVMSQMLQKYGHQVLDKLEQDAPQKVEHSEESNQAQPLTCLLYTSLLDSWLLFTHIDTDNCKKLLPADLLHRTICDCLKSIIKGTQ